MTVLTESEEELLAQIAELIRELKEMGAMRLSEIAPLRDKIDRLQDMLVDSMLARRNPRRGAPSDAKQLDLVNWLEEH